MANLYADLKSFKHQLLSTDSDDDTAENDSLYLEYLDMASRVIDNLIGGTEMWRYFYVELADKKFYTTDERPLRYEPYQRYSEHGQYALGLRLLRGRRPDYEMLVPDLLNLTAILYDDMASGITASDYDLFPLNANPKIKLTMRNKHLPPNSLITLQGKWGYQDRRLRVRWLTSTTSDADETTVEGLSATTTMVTGLLSDSSVAAGHTLWIRDSDSSPDDGEQVYVHEQTGTTATVERGVNGTTPVSHARNSIVELQLYPAPIKQSCIDLALKKFRGREVEWEGPGADVESFTDILVPIAPQILHYRRNRMSVTLL